MAQQDSCRLRISLLTCSPGEDLYSIFGHSALRVTDKSSGTDIVYNYGSFEFDDNFYYNFVRGGERLRFWISADSFRDFMYEYNDFNRSVIEQDLNLNCEEKKKLFTALKINMLKENRYYRYDFLFDNCSTRLRDIVSGKSDTPVIFRNILPAQIPTFRNLIHEYLNNGKQYWSKLGIDLLLGSKMDVPVTSEQAMFLPDYLMKGFDSSSLGSISLVNTKKLILPLSHPAKPEAALLTPGFTTLFLLLVFGVLSFIPTRFATIALKIFDPVFFFILGAIGALILVMWFATDHALCDNNYNILWALPFHLPVSFIILRNTNFTRRYFQVCLVFYILLLVGWFLLPQGMNVAFLPLVVLAAIRSLGRSGKINGYDRKNV